VIELPFVLDGNLSQLQSLMLERDAIRPWQRVTSNFMHLDIGHLLGNMFFLWGFGIVVEGKLGWAKFVPLYLAMGAIQCAIEQAIGVMLENPVPSLGASAAICGMMAMAMIWAPRNELRCIAWYGLHPTFFEVSILTMSALFIGWDVLNAWAADFELSTATLHVMGAVVGAVAGTILHFTKIVDCEGWDVFNVWFGDPTNVDLDELRRYK
jgi:membrane associated rhomboid family serine protease